MCNRSDREGGEGEYRSAEFWALGRWPQGPRESQNTQSSKLHFRALLTEGGARRVRLAMS
jgi:hypothetical protein